MRMPERPYVTSHLSEAFAVAHRLTDAFGHLEVTPSHLTLGMLHHGYNMVAQLLLYGYQVPQETLQRELEATLPPATSSRPSEDAIAWSASDEHILALAAAEAHDIGHDHHGCQHALLAFLRDPASPLAMLLAGYGATFDTVRRDVLRIYSNTMAWPDKDITPS
jgi:ATP-dependent Clp protease ATP-binding subunit ClpA